MHQLTITVPPNIPAPKFHLFQTIHIKTDNDTETGVIVGIEYTTLFTAIANHCNTYGWEYKVDFYFEAATEKLLSADEYETTRTYHEAKLVAQSEKRIR